MLVQPYKKCSSVPHRNSFMFCLFKNCSSFASIFYKQLPYFQVVFQEFYIFDFSTIEVFKDSMLLKVFSNLNDSMNSSFCLLDVCCGFRCSTASFPFSSNTQLCFTTKYIIWYR